MAEVLQMDVKRPGNGNMAYPSQRFQGGLNHMKRIVLLSLALVLVLRMGSLAANYVGSFGWGDLIDSEENVWETDPNNARAYSSMGFSAGPSNPTVRTTQFTTEAQIAQWSKWEFTGTKWTWFVRKPGSYYVDCITAKIWSNSDVQITFSDFADLEYTGTDAVKDTIDTYYGVGTDPGADDFIGWIPAAQLNEVGPIIYDSYNLHYGQEFKLWNRIDVFPSNSASTYRNTGTITMTLLNQKPWLDAEGNWNPADFAEFGAAHVTSER